MIKYHNIKERQPQAGMFIYKSKRFLKIVGIALLLTLLCPQNAYGQSLENKKNQIEILEKEENKIQENIKGLKGEVSKVSEKLKKAEQELEKAKEEKDKCEENIIRTEKNVEEKRELMKERIKFTYENPSANSLFFMIITSKSISDFLNIKEYVKQVALYDEKVLEDYGTKIKELEEEKESLLEIEKNIKNTKESLEKEKSSLLSALSEEKNNLSQTEEEKASLLKVIKEMEEYERRLLAVMRPPESIKVEKEISNEAQKENTSGRPVRPQIGEEELLAAIIYCEAGNEPYEGMLAVGSVVLNRVNSSRFPNTITEVVYAPGQFSPVASGRLAMSIERGLVNEQSKQAAKDVLAGNITGNWLFFRRDDGTREGQVISRQVFY